MRIGLLPPLEMGSSPAAASAGTRGPWPGPISAKPVQLRLGEIEMRQPETYGGSHVDLDHQ